MHLKVIPAKSKHSAIYSDLSLRAVSLQPALIITIYESKTMLAVGGLARQAFISYHDIIDRTEKKES